MGKTRLDKLAEILEKEIKRLPASAFSTNKLGPIAIIPDSFIFRNSKSRRHGIIDESGYLFFNAKGMKVTLCKLKRFYMPYSSEDSEYSVKSYTLCLENSCLYPVDNSWDGRSEIKLSSEELTHTEVAKRLYHKAEKKIKLQPYKTLDRFLKRS